MTFGADRNPKGQINVPEGFVEFSMQMMKRAMELRAKFPNTFHLEFQLACADFNSSPGGTTQEEILDMAAFCLLMSISPPTIEGQASGKQSN